MATALQHKRSTTSGSTPANGALSTGEIGINLADLKMWVGDASGVAQKIGGEDVAATLDFTTAGGALQGISVTGFKMNFTKADGTLTTYNIFQQMMLFSLFQGHFISKANYVAHTHSHSQTITWDNHTGESVTTGVPN